MIILAYVFGFFCIPMVAMKFNVEPQWILLYMSIWCAGVMVSGSHE